MSVDGVLIEFDIDFHKEEKQCQIFVLLAVHKNPR